MVTLKMLVNHLGVKLISKLINTKAAGRLMEFLLPSPVKRNGFEELKGKIDQKDLLYWREQLQPYKQSGKLSDFYKAYNVSPNDREYIQKLVRRFGLEHLDVYAALILSYRTP